MKLERLIDALGRPETYPHPVERVDIRQTHISVVALAGPYAYKVKKPLDLGFLDFTTLSKRLHFCHEEVRLNRRLAPEVYIGVVPLVARDGALQLEGEGTPIEYAVKMERLPEEATLLARLEVGALDEAICRRLAERVAGFHRTAAGGPEVDRMGRLEVVARNARENLEQSVDTVGGCVSEAVFGRLEAVLEQRLEELGPIIDRRAREHRPRDTHGDLHLDHVYLFPGRGPPGDLIVIDCIEFNERFRYADPVADMAFLVMDLIFRGRRDLGTAFSDAYFAAVDDPGGPDLLQFYVAYRAAVRGKVEGMAASEAELPPAERNHALRSARARWLLALSELEDPARRPGLVLVGGLPGTGKSTLAAALSEHAGFEIVSSDRVRKELAGLHPESRAGADFGAGLYTPEWDDRTYEACLERARALVFEGKRVVVDASFREAGRRRVFLDAALAWGVRARVLVCTAEPDRVRLRLDQRTAGPSDADWAVYEAAAAAWQDETDPVYAARQLEVPSGGSARAALAAAMEHLRGEGLASGIA